MSASPDTPVKLPQPTAPAAAPDPGLTSGEARLLLRPTLFDPEKVGRYHILTMIGEGGMGVVYKAEQRHPIRRTVAVKLLKPGMDSRDVLARFESERQALALMEHSNIAAVLDAGAAERGRPYFVMEYVPGEPITEFCDRNNYTLAQRLELFTQACDAVQHAHQKAIIHRDLKPSNLLVMLEDGKPLLKVIDFGVAKATAQRLTEKPLVTEAGQVIGTPEYMSPEQAEMSALDVDTRTDIYALGVVLYELLTGTLPFDSKTLRSVAFAEVQRIIRDQEPPRPSYRLASLGVRGAEVAKHRQTQLESLRRELEKELEWIPLKAMRKQRSERYASAAELGKDVRNYLTNAPLIAGPETAGYKLRKLVRRHKAALATAGVVSLALLVAVATLGWNLRDRSIRRARLGSEIALALDESGRARALAQSLAENPYQWEATLAAAASSLRRAEGLAAQDGRLEHDLVERLRADRAALDADEADRGFVARFEQIRIEQSEVDVEHSQFRAENAVPKLREAFRSHYGIEFVATPPARAAEMINARPQPVQEELIGALGVVRARASRLDAALLAWCGDVMDAADDDPWRRRARAALAEHDAFALESLAMEAPLEHQPASFWRSIADGAKASRGTLKLRRRIQEAHPDDFWANHDFAYALAHSDHPDFKEAIRYYTAAVALRPRNPGVYLNLGRAYEKSGDADAAIASYRYSISLAPEYLTARHCLASVLSSKGRHAEALTALREALHLKPASVPTQMRLGEALAAKGDHAAAIDAFRAAVSLEPANPQLHSRLGTGLADAKRFLPAVESHREAIRLAPDAPQAQTALAQTLHQMGDFDGAIEASRRAIALKPEFAWGHTRLGLALKAKGVRDEAVAVFRDAIRHDPHVHEAHCALAQLLEQSSTLDEAIVEFRAALAHDSSCQTTRSGLAHALGRKAWELTIRPGRPPGDVVRAATLAKEATDLAPRAPMAWQVMGWALYRSEDFTGAIAALNKSIELQGNGGDVGQWLFLAMSCRRAGDAEAARRWFDKADHVFREHEPDKNLDPVREEANAVLGLKPSNAT